jgi:lipoprotein-anchoring transpeptidase ErfK/SrfK
MRRFSMVLAAALLTACGPADDRPAGDALEQDRRAAEAAGERRGVATAMGRATAERELSREELEAGRLDPSWRQYAERRPGAAGADTDPDQRTEPGPADEAWDDISVERVNAPPALPVFGDVQGPSVAHVQILLDRARFSPGIIDGRWGKNTEKAVYWFQDANGLRVTGEVDAETLDLLVEVGGGGKPVRSHRLTERDVEGPFVDVPDDIYERAELECLCYESLREKLGEVFHASPELLEELNPGLDLNAVAAGDALSVPAVVPFRVGELPEGRYTDGNRVVRIVVSDGGRYLHAFDRGGNLLYHFPTTLGDEYRPPAGAVWRVESITFHPDWHYQPELLVGVDPDDEDAVIPAGPNNDVGIVWMALSEPHYGIHGTNAPETIGYATSSGCVRLTNWDAAFLARRVAEGAAIEFTDVARPDG